MELPEMPNGYTELDLRGVIEAMPHGVIVIDTDYSIQLLNTAFTVMTGVSAMETTGKKCYEIFPGDFCRTLFCPLIRIRQGADQLQQEGGKYCAFGRKTPFEVTACRLQTPDGRSVGIVEIVSDTSPFYESRERFRKAMGGVIQAMSLTIEMRDRYTAGHQRRVTKLCRAIAVEMGFSWDRTQGLRMAAAVHDLGKILVPTAILTKPGELSEHEMGIIRDHPQAAYDILKKIDFPWPIAETVYQHHERLDGSGYPRGLKGEEILLEARILAVADVTETMASFRPYRPALGMDAAMEEIHRQKGVRYDPEVVDTCIRLITVRGFDFQTKAWMRCKMETPQFDFGKSTA